MARKSLIRLIQRRLHRVVIWAMVPLAAISGRSVSGCLSATGQFDPNCRCCERMSAGTGVAATCCHCSCCKGKTCCCKAKAAGKANTGSGMQDTSHCRQIAVFAVSTAVKSEIQKARGLDTNIIAVAIEANPAVVTYAANWHEVAAHETGPPPDNLLVVLHRWLI